VVEYKDDDDDDDINNSFNSKSYCVLSTKMELSVVVMINDYWLLLHNKLILISLLTPCSTLEANE